MCKIVGMCMWGVAMKEFGLTYTINSKEISKPIHEILLEEQQIQERPLFFSAPYGPLTSFFLCQTIFVEAFLTSIESVGAK